MTAAFIVTLDVESTDPSSLTDDALLIEELLLDGGVLVTSVEPWARRGLADEPPMSAPPIAQGGATYGLINVASVLPAPVRPSNNQTPIQPIEPI